MTDLASWVAAKAKAAMGRKNPEIAPAEGPPASSSPAQAVRPRVPKLPAPSTPSPHLEAPPQQSQLRTRTVSCASSDNGSIRTVATTFTASHVLGRPKRASVCGAPLAAERKNASSPFDDFDMDEIGYPGSSYGGGRMSVAATPAKFSSNFTSSGHMQAFSLGPKNDTYIKPAASEIARSGWLWFKGHGEWEKYYVIATYNQTSKAGILQLYHSSEDLHPAQVLDLQQYHEITPSQSITELLSAPNPNNTKFEGFSVRNGYVDQCFAAVSKSDCAGWITALRILISPTEGGTRSGSFDGGQRDNETPSRKNFFSSQPLSLNFDYSGTQMETASLTRYSDTVNTHLPPSSSKPTTPTPPRRHETVESNTRSSEVVCQEPPFASEEDAEAFLDSITRVIDDRTTRVLEAVWSSYTTGQNTHEVTTAPTVDLQAAVVDLTESMEMRTSRIAKMVNDLLLRPDPVNAIEKLLRGSGAAGNGGVLETVLSKVEEISNKLGEAGKEDLFQKILGRMDEISAHVVETIDKRDSAEKSDNFDDMTVVQESQRQISNDLSMIISILAELGVTQRSRDERVLKEIVSVSQAVTETPLPIFDQILSRLDDYHERVVNLIDDKKSTLAVEQTVRLAVDDWGAKLEGLISLKFSDHAQVSAAIMSVLNDLSGDHTHSRSTTSSISNAEDFMNAKLDNILEVIDFVNKSQCRLVALVTEKLKHSAQQKSTQAETEDLVATITDRITEAIKKHGHKDEAETDIVNSITKLTATCKSIKESQEAFQISLDSTLPHHQTTRETPAPSTDLRDKVEDIINKLSGVSRSFNSRQDIIESWMNRNNDLLKHVVKGVQELEKMERRNDVAGALSGKEAVARIDALIEKIDGLSSTSLERTSQDSHGKYLCDDVTRLKIEQESLRESVQVELKKKAGLENDVALLEARREALRLEIEALEKQREENNVVAVAAEQLLQLETDLQSRVGNLIKQVKSLSTQKALAKRQLNSQPQ
ncbi:hypothetical protein HDU67_009383 [Dinochytrium kinnereticum]|nr:hypothetical protein HDU67_009383 [Dinochytrium kinnereticum]